MSYYKMNPIWKEKWLKALRSGKFRQCSGALKSGNAYGQPTYCCLGVLRELLPKQFHKMNRNGDDYLPAELDEELKLYIKTQETLAELNDEGYSFDTIAGWIERNI